MRRHRGYRARNNPLSSNEKIVIGGLSVLILGGIGLAWYMSEKSASASTTTPQLPGSGTKPPPVTGTLDLSYPQNNNSVNRVQVGNEVHVIFAAPPAAGFQMIPTIDGVVAPVNGGSSVLHYQSIAAAPGIWTLIFKVVGAGSADVSITPVGPGNVNYQPMSFKLTAS